MKSSNPFLNSRFYQNLERDTSQEVMTANGATGKATILILLVFGSALFGWVLASNGNSGLGYMGALVGFVLALVTMFKPHLASMTAPIYALCEGVFLGSMAFMFEQMYPGIASQAVMGTIGVFMVMMVLYRTQIIKVTDKMRSVMLSLMLGIFVVYLISFVLSFFTPGYSVFGGGIFGIGFSLFVIGVAAFSLLLDFDSIERAEAMGQSKQMEWFYAFSLLITLVWLYLEIFRLLAILRNSD